MTDNKEMPERVWIKSFGKYELIGFTKEQKDILSENEKWDGIEYLRADEVESEEGFEAWMRQTIMDEEGRKNKPLSFQEILMIGWFHRRVLGKYNLIKKAGGS